MTKYINKVRSGELSDDVVNRLLKNLSTHLVVTKMPDEFFISGNKLTSNLVHLPLFLVKGHKSWSGIAVCFPGRKEDLITEKIGTPYIRSILYPILELSRRVNEKAQGNCIYIIGEHISDVLIRKFRLLNALTTNIIILTKNSLQLASALIPAKPEYPAKIKEDFVQKTICLKLSQPDGLSVPVRFGNINLGYIKHELKTHSGTKESEKLDILAYDRDDGSLVAFEIKGPGCSRVELENLFLQGIEHQTWVEENKRSIKLFHEGPRGGCINTRKRVRLILGFFGDTVPALFHDLRERAEAGDRHLKIDFVRLSFDMFNELFLHRFPESGSVGCLMTLKPERWSLRGDPYLWEEMRHHLATTNMPDSVEGLKSIIGTAFSELTGQHINLETNFFVERYARGGMSSGHIDPSFWRNTILPLLAERFTQALHLND